MKRIYLDNAATSWPKSAEVNAAVVDYMQNCGATAGRGVYESGAVADRWLKSARSELARLIDADPAGIAFCQSGTHALNTLIHGLVPAGARVLTTALEHNSVLRPLRARSDTGEIAIEVIDVQSDGRVMPAHAAAVCGRFQPTLILVGHASNVTGAVQDLRHWSRLAQDSGAMLAVDISQTLGYLPIACRELNIDAVAAAGHKGLGAWPGTGLVYVAPHLRQNFRPLMTGGTGLASEQLSVVSQPWPLTVEVGNLNLPGIVAMAVAAQKCDLPTDAERALGQAQRLAAQLREIPGLQVIGYPEDVPWPHVPVVSVVCDVLESHDLATILASEYAIEVRAGLHCAALVHGALPAGAAAGTLRLSPGKFTEDAEIEFVVRAFSEIMAAVSP